MRVGINYFSIQDRFGRAKQIDGIGTYTRHLIDGLQSKLTVQPVYFKSLREMCSNPLTQYQPADNLYVGTHPMLSGYLPFNCYKEMEQAMDVFHSTDYKVPKLRHTPVLATVFDSIFLKSTKLSNLRLRKLKNYLLKKNMGYADHVVTITHAMKQDITQYWGIPEAEISVVHLGIESSWLTRQSAADRQRVLDKYNIDRNFILSVGTIQPRKNYMRILQAYHRLPPKVQQDTLLVVVGKQGWLCDEEIAAFEQLAAQGRIKWLQYIPLTELQTLYQASRLLLFPSLEEGFGFPVIEGFASQTPVVSSKIPVIEEVAGEAAYLVDPTSVDAIARAVQEVLTDDSLRQEYIDRGQRQVARYSWESTVDNTIALYRQLVK
jgi:glycosyltransferase involved in cell wall biosynthesis